MRKFGALKHLWTMCCESVHCALKQTDLTCKKNILKTVAFKVQTRMSMNCMNLKDENYSKYEVGDVIQVTNDGDLTYFMISSKVACDEKAGGELEVQVLQNFEYDEHYDTIRFLQHF